MRLAKTVIPFAARILPVILLKLSGQRYRAAVQPGMQIRPTVRIPRRRLKRTEPCAPFAYPREKGAGNFAAVA